MSCVAGAIIVSACTGGDNATPPTTTAAPVTTSTVSTSTTSPEPIDRRAFAFVAGALSDNTSNGLREVDDLVTPDSPAAMYLAHRSVVADIGENERRTITAVTDDSYTMCAGPSSCVTLSDPHFSPDGLLFDFAVDGVGLGELVASPIDAVRVGPLDLTLVSAYLRSDRRLVVVYDVTNLSEDVYQVAGFAARYDSPKVGSRDAISHVGGGPVAGGTTLRVLSAFDEADLGGTLTIAGADATWIEPWQGSIPLLARP